VTAPGRAGLDAILGDPDHALLAFDYDGVLAPIVDDPENAPPHPGAVAALARLAPRVGTVVIITGRPAEVVVAYGQFADIPALSRLVIFGHYGRERWDAESGQVHTPPTPDSVAAAAAELPDLLTRLGAPARPGSSTRAGRSRCTPGAVRTRGDARHAVESDSRLCRASRSGGRTGPPGARAAATGCRQRTDIIGLRARARRPLGLLHRRRSRRS
jgi:hypothetical protein